MASRAAPSPVAPISSTRARPVWAAIQDVDLTISQHGGNGLAELLRRVADEVAPGDVAG
jgi:hypothetical protein